MKRTNLSTNSMAILALPFLIALSLNASGQEAQPPGVAETWACSYNPGKDADDMMSARDYYLKKADKAGLTLGPAYLWTLLKGDVAFDTLWMAPHQSFAAFAAAADAEASADLSDVQERFDQVSTCSARMGTIRSVFQREGAEVSDAPVIISSSACRLKPGVGPIELGDLNDHIAEALTSLGDNAPNSAYALSPTTGGPNTPDLVIFTVNDSMTRYSDFITGMYTGAEGPALRRHLDAVADCNLALWTGQQVIAGPAE